jgi:hypothetical protein
MTLDPLQAQAIVESVQSEILASKGSRIWQDYVNALRLISQVVFTRSSGFVLELVQNCEDSGIGMQTKGSFEVRFNKTRAKVIHNGRPFTEDNLKALCGIRSSRKPEQGTLGYLGIGFKSVFKVTDSPEIYSGGFQFKFDRSWPEWNDPAATPWHVLPIWLNQPSEVIDNGMTTFVLPFRDPSYYDSLVKEVSGLSTQLYLFLRWLKKIDIIDEVSGSTWSLENAGETADGYTVLMHNGEPQQFKFFKRMLGKGTQWEIPSWVKQDRLTQEYRANVTQREIAIAFALDQTGSISPVTAGAMYGGVYSFLPLGEAKSGVKFPIQADFLVQPGRDAINYEAKWNQWLIEEVSDLCKEALGYLKNHDKWKFQILLAFDFSKTPGVESYDKFFGPKLIEPIEKYLREDDCFPTLNGGWERLEKVVRLNEERPASDDLVLMGVLTQEEIAPVLGEQDGLALVDPRVQESYREMVRKVGRVELLNNVGFLQQKRSQPSGAAWFRSLYLWLAKHPIQYKSGKKWQTQGYHQFEIVLTADGELSKGGDVWLPDLPPLDPMAKTLAESIQQTKPTLHPDILAGVGNEQEQKQTRGFLTGFAGVQLLDGKRVCKEALLPKIMTSASKPKKEDLLEHTMYCQRILGADVEAGLQFWVVTAAGDVKPAKETLFPREFRPNRDWETNQIYVPGLSFVSPSYLDGTTDATVIENWRQFLRAGGVKDDPDNGVEVFAMNYAKEKLLASYSSVTPVEKLNLGFDFKVANPPNSETCVEVKGSAKEQDVELTPAETETADKYGDSYQVCIVYQVPENPGMYSITNPCKVIKAKKIVEPIRMPASLWKQFKIN